MIPRGRDLTSGSREVRAGHPGAAQGLDFPAFWPGDVTTYNPALPRLGSALKADYARYSGIDLDG